MPWGLGHLSDELVQSISMVRHPSNYASSDGSGGSTRFHLERKLPNLHVFRLPVSAGLVVFFVLVVRVRAGNPMFSSFPAYAHVP